MLKEVSKLLLKEAILEHEELPNLRVAGPVKVVDLLIEPLDENDGPIELDLARDLVLNRVEAERYVACILGMM